MEHNYRFEGQRTLGIVTEPMQRRAALLFDKVFLIGYRRDAQESSERDAKVFRPDWVINAAIVVPNRPLRPLDQSEENLLLGAVGQVAEAICTDGEYDDYHLVPMYGAAVLSTDGPALNYFGALRHIPEVVEHRLSWDQISEFRRDAEATGKHRALQYWLAETLLARSISEAEGKIGTLVSDYEWSLKKHGIETLTGSVAMLYDAGFLKQLAGISAAAAAITANPIIAALLAGTFTAGKVSLHLAERRLQRLDFARRPDQLVAALIAEAKQLVS